MDTAFSRATGMAPGTASLVGSLQYISDTRPRLYRATSFRIREARWWPRHTLITQDHRDASEAVTAFQLSSWNGTPHSSVSTRLRKQSPTLEEGVVFDDKCTALSSNVLCRSFADLNKMQRLHSRPSGSEQLIAVGCDARYRRG